MSKSPHPKRGNVVFPVVIVAVKAVQTLLAPGAAASIQSHVYTSYLQLDVPLLEASCVQDPGPAGVGPGILAGHVLDQETVVLNDVSVP